MNITYEKIQRKAQMIGYQRLRQTFYKLRRLGLLTDNRIVAQLHTQFWLACGFEDLEDYLTSELQYSVDAAKEIVLKATEGDANDADES